VVVYDLGGGTFDVTVMRVEGGTIRVLAKGGNAELGGKDWDQEIVRYAASQFEDEHDEDPTDDPGSYQALYDAALNAKESLSRVSKARIVVNHNGKRTLVNVTRDEFNSMTAGLLDQTRTTLEGILQEVPGISGWNQVDKILLVGGSTRMPQVREMVQQVTGQEPSVELDPDACVAHGASIFAIGEALRRSEAAPTGAETAEEVEAAEEIKQEMKLLGGEVEQYREIDFAGASSRFYGVEALDESHTPFNSILIRRGDPIPIEKTDMYGTVVPNQTSIEIKILECERDERDPAAQGVEVIRQGEIVGIPVGLPAGSPIQVTFDFHKDGTLYVLAKEMTHGKELRLDCTPRGAMNAQELQEAKAKTGGLQVT
jgi:molecular chaperone DnaK